MTWFVESPWPSVMLGIGLEAILAIFLVRSGRAVVIAAMVGVLALTAGLVVLERIIVTQTEQVENTLDEIAGALESNDANAVLALFSSHSLRRAEVQSAMSRVRIGEAKIGGDLEIRLNQLTSPPSANAYFTGRVQVKRTRETIPYEHVVRKFKVTLRQEGNRYRVFDYEDADPRGTGSPTRSTAPGR
ncbi:MAG: hypothetical protein HY288_01515 [Planctomycetia bacterium]|nr:hypothetical protein [Planctomycetia bacterium]